jgi:tetrahydromethanopterin S-methyltransferase subunit C
MKTIITTITTITATAATVAIIVTAATYWGDWLIKEILNKDINNWIIAAAYLILCITTPKSLRGLPLLIMAVATVYVWVIK